MWLAGGGHCYTHYVASSADIPISLLMLGFAVFAAIVTWATVTGRTQTSPVGRLVAAPFVGLITAFSLVVGVGGLLGMIHFGCAPA